MKRNDPPITPFKHFYQLLKTHLSQTAEVTKHKSHVNSPEQPQQIHVDFVQTTNTYWGIHYQNKQYFL